jgi:hypothetical protein
VEESLATTPSWPWRNALLSLAQTFPLIASLQTGAFGVHVASAAAKKCASDILRYIPSMVESLAILQPRRTRQLVQLHVNTKVIALGKIGVTGALVQPHVALVSDRAQGTYP